MRNQPSGTFYHETLMVTASVQSIVTQAADAPNMQRQTCEVHCHVRPPCAGSAPSLHNHRFGAPRSHPAKHHPKTLPLPTH
eukprot:356120-Chlamydomonas_euryale.AAC.17